MSATYGFNNKAIANQVFLVRLIRQFGDSLMFYGGIFIKPINQLYDRVEKKFKRIDEMYYIYPKLINWIKISI